MVVREDQLEQLDGLIPHAIGLELYRRASLVPANQLIVEIGSYKGKSTCYLAAGAAQGLGAKVYAIDCWDLPGTIAGRFDRNTADVVDTFHRQVQSLNLNNVVAIKAFSDKAARRWKFIKRRNDDEGKKIGLLFVDGDHSFEGVLKDVNNWTPYVASNGFVIFDDYYRNRYVRRAVNSIKDDPKWLNWSLNEVEYLAIGQRA